MNSYEPQLNDNTGSTVLSFMSKRNNKQGASKKFALR
jgi:hypothetical protein